MAKSNRQNTAEATYKDTIQKLKAVCRNQQKELARLRKELDRREDVSDDYKELLNDPVLDVQVCSTLGTHCPQCSATVSKVVIGKFSLTRCNSCDWRIRKDLLNEV